MEILLHISVQWLSLEICITRVLRQFGPLTSYFKSLSMMFISLTVVHLKLTRRKIHNFKHNSFLFTDESQPRFRRLVDSFSNPMTEVYLLFFQSVLPVFSALNLLPQREKSSIFLLHGEVKCTGQPTLLPVCLFLIGSEVPFSVFHVSVLLTTNLQMRKFIKKLCARFMKPSALQGREIHDITYKDP